MKINLGLVPKLTVFAVFVSSAIVSGMKFEDFKTCSQSGFCRRNRAYADDVLAQSSFKSPYKLIADSIQLSDDKIYADIRNTDTNILLTLDLHILQDNTARVRINEKSPIKPRYDGHGEFTLIGEPKHANALKSEKNNAGTVTVQIDKQRKIIITPEPVKIEFLINDEPAITLNDRGFFNFEHLRIKESHKPKMVEKQNEDGTVEMTEADSEKDLWEETFKTWTDPKPNGPESIGLDITFNDFPNVYGIPEHASSLALKETRGGDNAYTEPYRLYNADVFEYALDSPTALYGSVPLMIAHKQGLSAGIFWMNPAETWIDIVKSQPEDIKSSVQKVFGLGHKETSTKTHWITEAGVLDIFVFFGPTTKDVLRQYHALTGPPAMPQMFAIAYHQSRWNYINQRDVLEVDSQFDENDMPYDVIWLDIEYTDEKRYFTWDEPKFPNPIEMEEKLDYKGRKLVTIIDPHIKRAENYYIADEAKEKDLFVKQADGKTDYEGWCWPGQSSWVDFVRKESYNWWKKQFRFDRFKGTRENVYLWHDMNEPSVFNGPEITIQKEMKHDGKHEHRVLHNLYGLLGHQATADGVRERTEVQKRPFVLARGFYAGSQRSGPVWTGDNMADWPSLSYAGPMILGNAMGGIPFSGSDVPGFFFNPTEELVARWYQAGSFHPFFRGHAHIDTKRREPYLFSEPYKSITRNALRERYALLSFWYTLFFDAYKSGTPMMRPMFMEFPHDESVFTMDDQFMVGSAILVKPVVTEGANTVQVYFPADQPWYELKTHKPVRKTGLHTVEAPLDTLPAYYQGGSIIPRRERPRRSSALMRRDPFTLVVAKGKDGRAHGRIYLDDEETYSYEKGAYVHTAFEFENNQLTCESVHENPDSKEAKEFATSIAHVRVERVQVLGVSSKPKGVRIIDNEKTVEGEFIYDAESQQVIIKDPKVSVAKCGWKVVVY